MHHCVLHRVRDSECTILSVANPILVEVIRGPLVESRHRGAVAVSDADGNTALAIGDVTTPIFPRSAVKALQALPLIEQGAAERFGLAEEELALACASHSGEPAHIAGVERRRARVPRRRIRNVRPCQTPRAAKPAAP